MSELTGIRQIDHQLEDAEITADEPGKITRSLFFHADRYLFDFNLDRSKWVEFDTESDAWYFGVWVNKEKLRTLSYMEGDIYFTQCADAESFDAELARMCLYHQPTPAFIGINPEKGERTDYYQGRLQFFSDPAHAPVPDIPETTPEEG